MNKKYFISYAAYSESRNAGFDLLNTTVNTDNELDYDGIINIEDELLKMLNKSCEENSNSIRYLVVQILFYKEMK